LGNTEDQRFFSTNIVTDNGMLIDDLRAFMVMKLRSVNLLTNSPAKPSSVRKAQIRVDETTNGSELD